jgi:hypothetical protein
MLDVRSPQSSAPAFRHRVAVHAASGALRDLLEHHGLSYGPDPLAEGTVFGLAGGLTLRVRLAAVAVPAADVEGRARALERNLCRHLGLGGGPRTTDDPGEGWRQLRAELDAGRPALLRADVAELDDAPGQPHDTRHVVVALRYDEDAGLVWLADPRFPEPRPCALDALARARASQSWPGPVRHALLTLPDGGRLAHPRDAVAAALRCTIGAMRVPEPDPHPHVHWGLAAADALVEGWPQLPVMAGAGLRGTLDALCARIRDTGTGGALHRSQQARFEHDAAALLGGPALGRAALVCDDLADAWRSLADALCDPETERAHMVAGPWLQRIRTLEHRHVGALETALRELQAPALA